jgi:hypothetical protein
MFFILNLGINFNYQHNQEGNMNRLLPLLIISLLTSDNLIAKELNTDKRNNHITKTQNKSKEAQQTFIDFYETNKEKSQLILNKYSKKIISIEQRLKQDSPFLSQNSDMSKYEKANRDLSKLESEIKKSFGFDYISIENVRYPNNSNLYITISTIESNQPEKLKYVNAKPINTKVTNKKSDVVNQMIEFESLTMPYMFSKKTFSKKELECPVFHCISTFENPKFKPYLKVFNDAAQNHLDELVYVLNNDKDPERRAAAIFIIGHLKDPNKIIEILLPQINSSYGLVRNNAMRAIASTIEKSHIYDINPLPFIKLLNSPFVADRNKSLLVLKQISKSDKHKYEIIKYGKDKLIANLRLKQPNNHNESYAILKEVSGKNYSDLDINGWEKWLTNASRNKTNIKT